jgi:hypothetical protein
MIRLPGPSSDQRLPMEGDVTSPLKPIGHLRSVPCGRGKRLKNVNPGGGAVTYALLVLEGINARG